MQKRRSRDSQAAINYHVARNHAAVFDGTTQQVRIDKCRALVAQALDELKQPTATIWELGCGSCDITGPFSRYGNKVTGIDCVAEAPQVVSRRFPNVQVWVAPVEWLTPQPCDVLVMCEFLEHVAEPVELVSAWLPLAKYAVIGHPLVDNPSDDPEEGHNFCYDESDLLSWFCIGGHQLIQKEIFKMTCYPKMGLALGKNTKNS